MESEKPLRLFVNPFTMWTQLALKTGEAMWATAHAAAVRANAPAHSPRVAVIPNEETRAAKPAEAKPAGAKPAGAKPAEAKPAEAMVASAHAAALRKAKAPVRQASKAARFKATRARLRSKANAKRRAKG
jgi:hypothetical protein